MSYNKGGFEQKEYGSSDGGSPRPRPQGRFKRHCARFWWLHLIVFVVISLCVILPVIYVGYPNIAQSDINKSKIITTAQVIRNPTANSVELTLDGVLETASIFHPTLDAFNASLYLEGHDTPFTTISVPQLAGKNGTVFQTQQTVQITDLQEFTAYCLNLLAFPAINITLKGSGGLKLGGLPQTHVNYNQQITLQGLNALRGIEVTAFHLGSNLPYGANAYGNVTIPNPSVSNLQLGDVSLHMFVDDVAIGDSVLPDLVLTPGNNSYPIYAMSNQTALLEVLKKPAYQCGTIPVTMKGNASIYEGEVLPYFTTALQASAQQVTLNLKPALEAAGLGALVNGTCQ